MVDCEESYGYSRPLMESLCGAPIPPPLNLSGLDTAIPVLEWPLGDTYSDTTAMLQSMGHGHPLVNGFSGYTPAAYEALTKSLQARDASAFPPLLAKGPLIVVVNMAQDGDGSFRAFVGGLKGTQVVKRSDDVVVFLVPRG